jgi:hypothetical protein
LNWLAFEHLLLELEEKLNVICADQLKVVCNQEKYFFPYFLIASLWESLSITTFFILNLPQIFSPPSVMMNFRVPRKFVVILGDSPLLVGNMVFLCPVKSSLPILCSLLVPYKGPQIHSP